MVYLYYVLRVKIIVSPKYISAFLNGIDTDLC